MAAKTCWCGRPKPCPEHHQTAAAHRRLKPGRWHTQRTRRDVFNRDGYTCRAVNCNHHDPTGRTLEAHHIRPIADGGPTALWNMLTLCTTHHHELERKRDQARRQKISERQ